MRSVIVQYHDACPEYEHMAMIMVMMMAMVKAMIGSLKLILHPPGSELCCSLPGKCDHSLYAIVEICPQALISEV